MSLHTALIGLGSNYGSSADIFQRTISRLSSHAEIYHVRVSSFFTTEPVGCPDSETLFLNAAAELKTSLEPLNLLHTLQEMESIEGRNRTLRWGKRTLDLDLLLYDNIIFHTPELILPHPLLPWRRFALEPVLDITPHALCPICGRSYQDLLSLLDTPFPCFLWIGKNEFSHWIKSFCEQHHWDFYLENNAVFFSPSLKNSILVMGILDIHFPHHQHTFYIKTHGLKISLPVGAAPYLTISSDQLTHTQQNVLPVLDMGCVTGMNASFQTEVLQAVMSGGFKLI